MAGHVTADYQNGLGETEQSRWCTSDHRQVTNPLARPKELRSKTHPASSNETALGALPGVPACRPGIPVPAAAPENFLSRSHKPHPASASPTLRAAAPGYIPDGIFPSLVAALSSSPPVVVLLPAS